MHKKKEITAVKNNRPVDNGLATFRMPIAAIASITHRITGVALLVAVGFLMWALSTSLESQAGFDQVQNVLTHWFAKFIAWGIASFIVYHFIAGIKHLLMDAGYFETKETGPLAAKGVFALSAVGILLVGVWIW